MPKTKIDIPEMLAMYAEHGGPLTAQRYGISRPYVYKLAHEHGVVSVVTRKREEAKRPKQRAGEPDAACAKRVVLVCPGCFWAKGVGRRSICPRLGCGKVRRREETA